MTQREHRRAVVERRRSRWTPYRVGWAAILVLTVALRIWMLSSWSWLQDDLLLTTWTTTKDFPEYVLTDFAGHVLTGELLIAWTYTAVDPLNYTYPAATIVISSVLVVVGWGLALREIFGERLHVLLGLVVLNLTPGMTAVSLWWISCLNIFPMLASMGFAIWFLARYVLGEQRRRDLVGMNISYALGLLMWEKSLLITVPLLFVVLLLGPSTLRRAVPLAVRVLWPTALISVAYLGFYAWSVHGSSPNPAGPYERTLDTATTFATHGMVDTTLPALFGGPFLRMNASLSAFPAAPSAFALVLWSAAVALGVIGLVFRRRGGLALSMTVLYAAISWGLVFFSSRFPGIGAGVLAVPRYSADLLPVVVLTCLFMVTPTRLEKSPLRRPVSAATRRRIRQGMAVYVVIASVVAVTTTTRLWSSVEQSSTKPYMDTLLAESRALGKADVYDSVVPQELVSGALLPEASRFSMILSPLELPLRYNGPSEQLLMVDASGHYRKAAIPGGVRAVQPGPDDSCGYAIEDGPPVEVPLDGEPFDFEWGMEITYFTGSAARIAVETDRDRVEMDLPVNEPGDVGRQQVLISGKVTSLTIEKLSGESTVCVTEVKIGNFETTDEVPDQLK